MCITCGVRDQHFQKQIVKHLCMDTRFVEHNHEQVSVMSCQVPSEGVTSALGKTNRDPRSQHFRDPRGLLLQRGSLGQNVPGCL